MKLFVQTCLGITIQRSRFVLVALTLLLGVTIPAWAQEAEIVGTVTDTSGGAIPGVSITATNNVTGLARTTLSNDVGQYSLPSLRIGRYNIKAALEGFKTAEQKDLVLQVGDRARVDLRLEVGEVSETVTVASDAVAVQSESGEISSVITGQQVQQIATNGRSIYSLVALVPGTTSNLPDTQVPTSVGGNANVSFNGQRMSHNIYLIDGGENLDRGGAGTIAVMPSIDAIAEFRALSSNYAPEYGLSSAGTMTMILQSGTPKYHGSAWEFNRNDAYNARNFFQAKKTPVRFNVFGFNVSGPIIPTDDPKSFFFFNMEWRKSKSSSNFNRVVPLPSTYSGNFGSTTIKVPTAAQLSPAMQAKFTAAGLTLGEAFPNNAIPTSLLDPAAQSLLKAGIFPAPTDGANRYVGSVPTPTDVREEIVRIDHAFSEKFTIFGHWISDHVMQTYNPTMWSGSNVPTVSNTFGNPSFSAVVHTVYTISPTLLMESAFNYNGNRIHILPAGLFARPTGFVSKELFDGNEENRIPQIGLGGSTGATYSANWVPWNNKADDYQVRQDIAWTRGEHHFKFGASWALYKKIQDLFTQTQGVFGFNGTYTGNDFADFLLGMANSYQEATVKDAGNWNNNSWAAYVQDHWRVNKQLTLDFGLRWDGIPHTYEANHRMSNFYPHLYDPAKKAILLPNGTIDPSSPGLGTSPVQQMAGMQLYLNGIGITGVGDIPNGMTKDKWWNFGPRVGFAYDLTGAGKTVLRGGFGIMYERIQGNDMYNGGGNSPFSLNVNNNNVLLSDPSTSIQTGVAPPRPISVGSLQAISLDDYNPTTSYQYSFGVERELGKSVVSVAYVGNRTHYLSRNRQINIPDQSRLADLINGVGPSYNTLLPYLGWGNIGMYENLDKSHYNSLQVSLRGQVARDLNLQGAYTWSRAIDPGNLGAGNGGDLNNIPNPYDPSYGIGRSLTDRTHVAVFNFIWDLPVLRTSTNAVAKAIAGGWQMSGVVLAQTGNPLNITLGGKAGSNGVSGGTNRPNVSGDVNYPKTVAAWFDKSAFSAPTIGQWGNLEYGSVNGPGRHNWNLALFKSFQFNERGSRLEIRIESFNTWNHTQFSGVSTGFSSSNFGQVTGVQDPRNLQLGLKLLY